MNSYRIRSARTSDVSAIQALVDPLASRKVLIAKQTVAYYESIQEIIVAESQENLIGCGALHVIWEDLGEIRTLAVDQQWLGAGVGHRLVKDLLQRARDLGIKRVFCLTFEVEFFRRQGFEVMADQSAVSSEVYAQLLHSPDEGVAEFLDLAQVKPNTLGNTRMILQL